GGGPLRSFPTYLRQTVGGLRPRRGPAQMFPAFPVPAQAGAGRRRGCLCATATGAPGRPPHRWDACRRVREGAIGGHGPVRWLGMLTRRGAGTPPAKFFWLAPLLLVA